jgi:peptidoglycan/LPS O-acetylase OafA/YrhL
MLGDFDAEQFDPVLWSLVQEMRISLVFPVIALAAFTLRFWSIAAIVASVESLLMIVAVCFPHLDTGVHSWPATAHFAMLFLFGAWLAKNHVVAGQRLQSLPRTTRITLAFAVFLLYSMGIKTLWGAQFHNLLATLWIAHPSQWANPRLISGLVAGLGDWIAAGGGGFAIVAGLHSFRVRTALHHPIILQIGRASFSLYLLHGVVLLAFLYLLAGTPYFVFFVPCFIAGTALLTPLFYLWVEVPTMNLGRRLAKQLQPRQLENQEVVAQ